MWGAAVEYDIDIPVTAEYLFRVCYAAAEPRPVQIWLDGKNLGRSCVGVTLDAKTPGPQAEPTWSSSGANIPYYGTYAGKREPSDKDDPNFRPAP